MKKQQKIITDTSIFVNPASRSAFGETPDKALASFLACLSQNPNIHCYMPPSAWEELNLFLKQKLHPRESILIKKQPPDSYQGPVPALFVYELIEEMRLRINKGLRIAEKYARQEKAEQNAEQNQETIKKLRTEYRAALREGIVDSKADFDLILLAKQIGASIATSDNGLVKWAQKLGIPCLQARELLALLEKKSPSI